ncbi:putative copper resistance protein D [Rhizobium tibeticum]|uniref:Copper resistance protein D n=1 Tax=Rhizobium tibeticum TaxID=501024 RepID=A0A1H8IFG4_9HYPH|nr:copper homeostasis membrane protein CopD [Rhizobium tibeticum]SEH70871.1 Inner membrane protein YebZ [Rhizobium tibeticum]SEN67423.1 putative copper resistance protein D [Rhizobium tibeticum]
MTPDAALILCRFLFDAAAVFLWGASAYLCWVVPADLAAQVSRRLRNWYILALLLVIGTTASLLPLRAATIGEGWSDALVPEMMRTILSGTTVGQAWIAQAGATVLLAISRLAPLPFRDRARAIIAGLLLLSLTISGHAAMNSGALRAPQRLNDGLHLLSGGAWLGALVPVIVILAMLRDARWQNDARAALMRFSTAGHVAVAVVIATGIINTFLIIGSPPLNWRLDYQFLLSVKIVIVFVLVALAITNRYILVPRLARSPSLQLLKWATGAEMVLGLAVLGLVSVFGTMPPT